jgi:hypothetical protein
VADTAELTRTGEKSFWGQITSGKWRKSVYFPPPCWYDPHSLGDTPKQFREPATPTRIVPASASIADRRPTPAQGAQEGAQTHASKHDPQHRRGANIAIKKRSAPSDRIVRFFEGNETNLPRPLTASLPAIFLEGVVVVPR